MILDFPKSGGETQRTVQALVMMTAVASMGAVVAGVGLVPVVKRVICVALSFSQNGSSAPHTGAVLIPQITARFTECIKHAQG